MGRSTRLLQLVFLLSLIHFFPELIFFVFCAFRGLHFPKEEAANQFHRSEYVPKSPIYAYSNSQLRVAHLVLDCTLVYWSFQNASKAIKAKDPWLPYIDVWVKGYVFSPIKIA